MKIAVVGGGITGLVTAWALKQKGIACTLFERRNDPGGSIKSVRNGEWLLEYGPNTIQVRSRKVLNLLQQLGLEQEIRTPGESASKRYIVKGGELTPLPGSMMDFLKTDLFPLRAKGRLLLEPITRRGTNPEETLASFVRRRLGEPFLDYAVNPFVAGIYAGDPAQLSVRHAFPKLYELEQRYGSLILGSLIGRRRRDREGRIPPQLLSFQQGLQTLPEALARQLDRVEYGATVERVQRGGEGWFLTVNGEQTGPFERVLLTIPLYHQSEQLINGGEALLKAADQLIYPPLTVFLTGYRRDQIAHPLDGFGFLVPEAERRDILGSLFNSTLFPGRAPEGHVLLTSFVGGVRNPSLARLEGEELQQKVTTELKSLLDISGDPVFVEHIFWPKAIPNYTLEYGRAERAIRRVEELNPGVFLGGNFRGGISLPDCMENGLAWADKLSGAARPEPDGAG